MSFFNSNPFWRFSFLLMSRAFNRQSLKWVCQQETTGFDSGVGIYLERIAGC